MDDRPASLLIGNYVAVATTPTDPSGWPEQTVKGDVRVGLITDLKDRYIVCLC